MFAGNVLHVLKHLFTGEIENLSFAANKLSAVQTKLDFIKLQCFG